ncbi:MAG: peptidoglycan glycosyltransferase [Draconibacterium sp.]|nr:MAG: peptidoglycan glycosyltransferase [Draconibacterium sp.]
MSIRKIIVSRLAIIYFLLLLFGVGVIANVLYVQKIKNEEWQKVSENLKNNTGVVHPNRGNICADDGSVLATSVPGYLVRIDLAAEGVKKVFDQECDSLAYFLANFFKNKSKAEYKKMLQSAYKSGNRGLMLTPRKVDYTELKQIEKFPILRRGRFGGGKIVVQENKRENPLGDLALRTIGDLNKGAYGGIHGNIGYTGLEGAYEQYLKGKDGVSYKQNLSGRWVDRIEIEPKDGMDIITTINIKLQDIAESALLRQMESSHADWGTAILMEVKTGEIKAIANLGLKNGTYKENYNYALGHAGCYEPGSTFKLMSLMAVLEDGYVDTSDVFNTGNGVWKYKDRTIYDSDYKHGGHGKMTVKQIFEKSSNVGVAQIITSCYKNKPADYVDRIYSFGVNKPLGLKIKGEGQPFFKYPGDKAWWGTTLAWMSYGYETKMTPLQILAFYNAVANNGKKVKPMLVKEIRHKGVLVQRYKTTVLNPMIVSKETVRKAQKMLEGVCERGTARSLKTNLFKIAGKTGTAQISQGTSGYQKGMYLASFAGYFPADNPIYSMIVTVNNPRGGRFYGGSIAGPVFKEIAEKAYAARIVSMEYQKDSTETNYQMPMIKNGKTKDILQMAKQLGISMNGQVKSPIAKIKKDKQSIEIQSINIKTGKVPDVRGMGAGNAVFMLENEGLIVKIKGSGKVIKQSLQPGKKVKRGQNIYITLS